MHRQASPSWNITPYEVQERDRLFWVVYTLDKTISLRCGRPSVKSQFRAELSYADIYFISKAISDDDINCDFPQNIRVVQHAPKGNGYENNSGCEDTFDFFLSFVRYARICSRISKQLYSAFALSRPSQDLLPAAAELDDELRRWCKSIPFSFRPGKHTRPADTPSHVPFIQALILGFGYNYAICAIYRRFNAMFRHYDPQTSMTDIRSWEMRAGAKDLEAARMLILLTKYLDIESTTQGWYVDCVLTSTDAVSRQVTVHIFRTNSQPGLSSRIL
jgi:hypothetical protein